MLVLLCTFLNVSKDLLLSAYTRSNQITVRQVPDISGPPLNQKLFPISLKWAHSKPIGIFGNKANKQISHFLFFGFIWSTRTAPFLLFLSWTSQKRSGYFQKALLDIHGYFFLIKALLCWICLMGNNRDKTKNHIQYLFLKAHRNKRIRISWKTWHLVQQF